MCAYDLPRKKSDLSRAVDKLDRSGPWDIEDLVQALIPVRFSVLNTLICFVLDS